MHGRWELKHEGWIQIEAGTGIPIDCREMAGIGGRNHGRDTLWREKQACGQISLVIHGVEPCVSLSLQMLVPAV